MAMHTYIEFTTLWLKPVVVNGEIELKVINNVGATSSDPQIPDLLVEPGDEVLDSVDIVTGTTTQVKICVKDTEVHEMIVYSSGNASQWSRLPSGAANYSSYDVTIPPNALDETPVALLILAKDNTGGVVARRSQTIIIKHRDIN